jgi:hypothetical protein
VEDAQASLKLVRGDLAKALDENKDANLKMANAVTLKAQSDVIITKQTAEREALNNEIKSQDLRLKERQDKVLELEPWSGSKASLSE